MVIFNSYVSLPEGNFLDNILASILKKCYYLVVYQDVPHNYGTH